MEATCDNKNKINNKKSENVIYLFLDTLPFLAWDLRVTTSGNRRVNSLTADLTSDKWDFPLELYSSNSQMVTPALLRLSMKLQHTHNLSCCLSLPHTYTHSLSCCLSLPHTYTQTHTHNLSCCLSLPHTYTQTHTYSWPFRLWPCLGNYRIKWQVEGCVCVCRRGQVGRGKTAEERGCGGRDHQFCTRNQLLNSWVIYWKTEIILTAAFSPFYSVTLPPPPCCFVCLSNVEKAFSVCNNCKQLDWKLETH